MKRIFTNCGLTAAIALLIYTQNAEAQSFISIVNNLGQTAVGNGQIGSGQFEAQEFNPGSISYTLTSIQAQVGGLSGTLAMGAELVQDNGNTPAGGNVLTTFSFSTVGVSFENNTFIPTTSGVVLNANTDYWFVLNYSAGSGTYDWNYAGVQTAAGPGSLGHYGTSFDNGSTWVIDNFGPGTPNLLQVNGTVPEPATLSLAGLGLAALIAARRRK